MPDGAQATEQIVEALIGQGQRIAARDQHVADLGMRGDIVERLFPLRAAEGIVATRLADHARARAVAAIGRAEAGGEEQHAVRVAMDETWNGGVAVLAERIVSLARRLQIFGADRNVRSPQRLRRVVTAHQARIVGRDAERQRTLMTNHGVALVVGQDEDALELGERADAPPRLPAPIVPLGEPHLGEIALAEGAGLRPDREALQARGQGAERLGRDGRRSVDGMMRLSEECCCRVATGRLFRLAGNEAHWIWNPLPLLWSIIGANRQPVASVKSGSHFSDSYGNFKGS